MVYALLACAALGTKDRDPRRPNWNGPKEVDKPGRERNFLRAAHRIGDDAAAERSYPESLRP